MEEGKGGLRDSGHAHESLQMAAKYSFSSLGQALEQRVENPLRARPAEDVRRHPVHGVCAPFR